MATKYNLLDQEENWLADELVRASQHNLHITLRLDDTRSEFYWLWSPTVLHKVPKTWDWKSLMFSKAGGAVESVHLSTIKITPSKIHISGDLLSNQVGNDESIDFDLSCTRVQEDDVLFRGTMKIRNNQHPVVFLSNDTNINWWYHQLMYLDSSVKPGDEIRYDNKVWKFVSWDVKKAQVFLKMKDESTSVRPKHCQKKSTKMRGLTEEN